MTTKERKQTLKDAEVQKYEKLKYKEAILHHNGEIDEDSLHLRVKFIANEEKRRLEEIDQYSANKAKKEYEKLIKRQNNSDR